MSYRHVSAIDQYGQVMVVLMSEKRDLVATRRFCTRVLEHDPRQTEVEAQRLTRCGHRQFVIGGEG